MNWSEILEPIKNSEYFTELWKKVKNEYAISTCYPPKKEIFRALELTPFHEIKVVILGQDPYHNVGQANGLCFSVSENVIMPPSLKNIFSELSSDLGIFRTQKDLKDWATQGVLLLNTTLTVRAHEANSHKNLGWEVFTDFIIKAISEQHQNVVFVLWGAFAQKKIQFIDKKKHLVIQSAHPSPLSAHKGFLGSKPFSSINNYLQSVGKTPIQW